MKIKTGVIGFGKMGLLHGAILSTIKDVELITIVDKSRMVLKAFQSLLPQIKYYTSYQKMLLAENELDAVVIATPIFNHVEIIRDAIEKDIHVFVEKPLGKTYEDTLRLRDLLESNPNVIGQVGFAHRYIPTFSKCKNLLLENVLGDVKKVKGEMYISDVFKPLSGWRYDPKLSGGGVLIDFTIHLIDLLHWFFGDVTNVSMRAKKLYSKEVEDDIAAEITFEKGFVAEVMSSWSSPRHRKSYTKVEIQGEKGSVVVTDQTIDIAVGDSQNGYTDPDLYSGYFVDIAGAHFSLQMETFINSIINKKQPDADIRNAIYVQKIVDVMYRSANIQRPLAVQGKEEF